jgi:hypothetical protein
MRNLVRGAALLLFVALTGFYRFLEDIRFVLAGAAIVCLVEVALALRARAHRQPASADRSRIPATRVSYTEQDGAISVTLTGEKAGPARAPYVLLSRAPLGSQPAGPAMEDRPYLELSDPRWSMYGGIQDAYLSPQLLRLTLNPRGAEVLGADMVSVALLEGNDQRRLERALGRILRGVPFTSERSIPEPLPDVSSSLPG